MKEQIIEILLYTLSYAYCDNCGYEFDKQCEDCRRKYQNWKLGRPTAEEIADKIIDNVIKPIPKEWEINDEFIQSFQKVIDEINKIGLINSISKEELDEI